MKISKKLPHMYWSYTRGQWMERTSPFTLKPVRPIKLISDKELKDIYLPLAVFIKERYQLSLRRRQHIASMLEESPAPTPFIIGISGSVAAGKSTIAVIFKELLAQLLDQPAIDIIPTDNFLFSNEILEKKGLLEQKGFPESYDTESFIHFLQSIKFGQGEQLIPVYSHASYDIIPNKYQTVRPSDIFIVEGINTLQRVKINESGLAVPDFLDYAIYIDAPEDYIIEWFLQRIESIFLDNQHIPSSYFHQFAGLSVQGVRQLAKQVWEQTNGPNLRQFISPAKYRADLILEKDRNHQIKHISLKKI
ncbi:type I pantothenate kinase [Scopulibacillus daqui]|uniref:Pantothenate kinase n=1 Tax=Scopulibacillus daqui TaxID=1469162 RepID=A0ABS2Q1J7_9BACL|nr:type I pantothenate kinase [Scopulibacillus daqui]MBM7646157.1 type I pantothenate kinase [Scopulibacillus daqui]